MLEGYELFKVDLDGLFEKIGACKELKICYVVPSEVGSPISSMHVGSVDKSNILNYLEKYQENIPKDVNLIVIQKDNKLVIPDVYNLILISQIKKKDI